MPIGSVLDEAEMENGSREPVNWSARFVNGLLDETHPD